MTSRPHTSSASPWWGTRRSRRPELGAAAVLAVTWIALWIVFVTGVAAPAAALHGPRPQGARENQVWTAPSASAALYAR